MSKREGWGVMGWSRSKAVSRLPAGSLPAEARDLKKATGSMWSAKRIRSALPPEQRPKIAQKLSIACQRGRATMPLIEIQNVTKHYRKGGETITPLDDV